METIAYRFLTLLFLLRKGWALLVIATFMLVSCGKDDDSPVIEEPEEQVPDLNRSDVTIKIMEGTDLIGSFIRDTTIALHEGLNYTKINYTNSQGLPMQVFIMEADLKQPDVNLQAMSPYNDYLYGFQQISEMCRDNQREGRPIYAAINGDFYNTSTGQWQSIFYANGYPIQANPVANDRSAFVVYKDKSLHIWYNTPDRQIDPEQVDHAVGGAHWLISYGQKLTNGDASIEPRTAIGYTENQVVYSVVVDGRQVSLSNGMGIHDIRDLLYSLDCYDAINLDGGGSSTMVLRDPNVPRGFQFQNSPSDGQERAVANGLAFTIVE